MKAAWRQPCLARIAAVAAAMASVEWQCVCRQTLTWRASRSTMGRVGKARISSATKCRYGVCTGRAIDQ